MRFSEEDRSLRTLLSVADALFAALAFEASYAGRVRLWRVLPHTFFLSRSEHILMTCFWVAAWLCCGYWIGIYQHQKSQSRGSILRETIAQAAYSGLALVLFEYALRLDISRLFAAGAMIFTGAMVLAARLHPQWITLFLKEHNVARKLLIGGTGPGAIRTAAAIEDAYGSRVSICGFVSLGPPASELSQSLGYPVIPAAQVTEVVRSQVVDEIVFSVSAGQIPMLQDVFRLCDEHGIRRRIALDFLPDANGELRIESLGSTPLLTFDIAPDDAFCMLVKRVMDVLLASAGLLIAFPVMLAAAFAIRLTSPGPIIFRQQRCGLNGRRFVCYKFRSMVADAEQRKAEVIHLSRRQTAPKIPNDPRLTRVGRFLRKCSIDELPQLLNILRGDMSLVGPRPAVPSEVAQYENWQLRRLRMRPGLTCLWAVNGRDHVDFDTWMKMDLHYIENWSLGLDCSIILKTIPAVLSGKGAS